MSEMFVGKQMSFSPVLKPRIGSLFSKKNVVLIMWFSVEN